MDVQNQIVKFAEENSLKEKALASLDQVMDESIKSDEEIGVDFLDGHNRSELIYEFGRYELQIDKHDNYQLATKIYIYSKRLYGPNFDVPVGYYTELTDLTGEHLDEFLVFDWSPIDFDIKFHIEQINKDIPQKYFRRNMPEYEFATYVNHIISLFQGKQFDGVILFMNRCLTYLEKSEKKEIEKEYLSKCLDLFKGIYHFVKNNELVEADKVPQYDKISLKLKTKS